MYNKLFSKILDSSIWLEPSPTRIVWITLLAAMDEQGFCQFASVANLAHRAVVPLEEGEQAVACLEGADPNSSDPSNDGKRIQRVPGGWMILNARKHRDMVTRAVVQEQTRLRVKHFRERQKRKGNAPVTPSETESETTVRTGSDDQKRTKARTRAQEALKKKQEKPDVKGRGKGHQSHVFCGGRFCVPWFQHEQFQQRLWKLKDDFDLPAFYLSLEKELGDAVLDDNPRKWVDKKFTEALRATDTEGA
jgi:hypothetical protein